MARPIDRPIEENRPIVKITIIQALKKLWNATTELLAGKQDTLVAGNNITINNGIISASQPDVSKLATKAELGVKYDAVKKHLDILDAAKLKMADISLTLDNFGVGYITTSDNTILVGYIKSDTIFREEYDTVIGCAINFIALALVNGYLAEIPYTNQTDSEALAELEYDLYQKWGYIWLYNAAYARTENNDEKITTIYNKIIPASLKTNYSYQDFLDEIDALLADESMAQNIVHSARLCFEDKSKSTAISYSSNCETDIIDNSALDINGDTYQLDGYLAGIITSITNDSSAYTALTAGNYILFPLGEREVNINIDTSAKYITVNDSDVSKKAYRNSSLDLHQIGSFNCFETLNGELYFLSANDYSEDSSSQIVQQLTDATKIYDRRGKVNSNATLTGTGNGMPRFQSLQSQQ